jgi:hypothetical protein
MKILSEDETLIAVWRAARVRRFVLIHGAAADHNRWAPVLPALEERFAVFAVDRRGRGRSGDATDYALEREYEDAVAVVDSAGEAVGVLGWDTWSHRGTREGRAITAPLPFLLRPDPPRSSPSGRLPLRVPICPRSGSQRENVRRQQDSAPRSVNRALSH